ncbi:lantibiotic dehydratase [Streptomyces sp. NPDC001642]|uniref:lantibiotic dehydratase n=1 Tax=Streptomyces sp. NPDC001642 TaxID=3154392 RepID=UPI00333431FC
MALTEPVQVVLESAREPICAGALADKLVADFPGAGPDKARRLVEGLIRNEVLITSLHAPSTETDAVDYLLAQLDALEADAVTQVAETIRELRAVQADLRDCGSRSGRRGAAARMRALVPVLRRHPLALDLCLDAEVEREQGFDRA